MNYYVSVAMGLGGNIALSSVITQIKKDFPGEHKFYILSPYYDLFKCNESVDGVYKPEEIRDFIFDAKYNNNSRIIMQRIYDMDEFIRKSITYKLAWYKLFGIEPLNKDSDLVCELNVFDNYPGLRDAVNNVKDDIKNKGYKDYIIVSFEGGVSPLQKVPQGQDGQPDWSKVPDPNATSEPLARMYPHKYAAEFIKLYMKANPNTAVINYTLPNQANYNVGELKYIIPYLAYYELAKDAKEVVCIDSSLQHLVAGVCPTTVIWGHSINADNSGNIICNAFGYDRNNNIVQDCRRDDILFFSQLGPSGARISYIEPEELLNAIQQKKESK